MPLRLLCVVAHPDDECFGFGGALALAASRGVETTVLCLTDGQAATARGGAADGAELGRMRREEFAASCAILGVSHYELLNYQDGALEFVRVSEAASDLVERMRLLRPDVVLTFGLEGGLNRHADHTTVSVLASAAFHWAGHEHRFLDAGNAFQPQRLFHLSTHFFLPDRQPPYPEPWTVRLDISSVLERKNDALRAHRSQAPLLERTRDVFEQYGRFECYTLVASSAATSAVLGSDLFAGLQQRL